MIEHLQRGLWEAKQKVIAAGLILLTILIAIVVIAGFSVIRTAAGTQEQSVLGESVPLSGKLQAITESLTCLSDQCPEAEGAAAFLDTIVAPSATYTLDGGATQALAAGSTGWHEAALSITGNGSIDGAATSIRAEGSLADFEWDGTQWSAEFRSEGDTQQLASLTRTAP